MSGTGDNVSFSIEDLNTRLQSLWEQDSDSEDQSLDFKHDSLQDFIDALRNSSPALKKFRFSAAPNVTSLCNHETVLRLTLSEGQDVTDTPPKEQNLSVDVKVPFFANASKRAFALDIKPAEIIESPSVPGDVTQYIRAYLDVLSNGFDELFSNHYTARLFVPGTDEVSRKIADYLSRQWMNAKSREGHLSACLATLSTVNLRDYPLDQHFAAAFAAPRVQNLCGSYNSCHREVVLTFQIEKIIFSKTGDFKEPKDVSTDWEIACVVGFTENEDSENAILQLDGARYAKCFSKYPKGDLLAGNHFEKVADFLASHYCKLLIQYSIDIVRTGNVGNNQPGELEMVVLPPCSIESHFNRLYRVHDKDVTPFAYKQDIFYAEFDCISTSFEVGKGSVPDSVIISFNITKSMMKVDGNEVRFPRMEILFKVGIDLTKIQRDENYTSHCLALNLTDAQHVESESNPPKAFLKYIRKYLHGLSSKGYNIFYSVPMTVFEKLHYKIIPGCCSQKTTTGCANIHCDADAKDTRLVMGIVMCARTTSFGVPPVIPQTPFREDIVTLWHDINATMTLLTVSIGRHGGSSQFAVRTWKEEFECEQLPRDELTFESNRLIRYCHQERLTRVDAWLLCKSENEISLDLDKADNILGISFKCRSELEAKVQIGMPRERTTYVEWSASICILSDEEGLHVKPFVPDNKAVVMQTGGDNDNDLGLLRTHKQAFDEVQIKEAFNAIVNALQEAVRAIADPPAGQAYLFVDPGLTEEGNLAFGLKPKDSGNLHNEV